MPDLERTVGANETLEFDVYIGGPSNNIEEWWDADLTIWDQGAYTGANHMVSMFMTQVIKDAFDWAVGKAPSEDDLCRTTCILVI